MFAIILSFFVAIPQAVVCSDSFLLDMIKACECFFVCLFCSDTAYVNMYSRTKPVVSACFFYCSAFQRQFFCVYKLAVLFFKMEMKMSSQFYFSDG